MGELTAPPASSILPPSLRHARPDAHAPVPLNPSRSPAVLEAYRSHVQERAAQGIVPKPLSAEWTAQLV